MRPKRGSVFARTGSPYWWLSFTANGRRYSKSSEIPKTEPKRKAYAKLDTLIGNARRGITPDAEKVILDDLERLVTADLEARGKVSMDRAKRAYWHLKQHLAGTPALQIPPIADEYITARRRTEKADDGTVLKQGASNATIRQELRWLGRGYALACRKGLLPSRPVLPSVEVQNARQGFVTEEQLETLLAHLPDYMVAPTRFAFWTAWRKSEILSLRWASVDLENGVARVEVAHSKTRRSREFPFGQFPELVEMVKEQRAVTTAWERANNAICPLVFHHDGQPIRAIYSAWRRATKAASLEGIVFHDLRRSGIRQMELAGVPRSTAMRLSGHLTESTYTRYAISAQADLEAGVAKIAALRATRAARRG